jgi:hypothetical protein
MYTFLYLQVTVLGPSQVIVFMLTICRTALVTVRHNSAG